MEKKEYYHHILPHFQQPGHAYFITWNLRNAIPPKALIRYTQKLELIKSRMDELLSRNTELKLKRSLDSFIDSTIESNSSIKSPYFYQMETLKLEYYAVRKKYLKAYDDLLDTQINPLINLTKPENLEIIFKTLQFWEGKKLKNIAFCIMPNHVHWLVELMEKDNLGQSVYLQDVLKSVKQFSSNAIKKVEQRSGTLWQKESFDTTIRDEKHLYYAKRYTINNPVKAGYVSEWRNWKGTWCDCSDI